MKLLIGLQDYDKRIMTIQSKKDKAPGKIKALEDNLAKVQMEFEEDFKQSQAYAHEKREIDQAIEDLMQQAEKSNVKLSNIKSNKEYRAALKEINDIEKQRSSKEDKLLEIMEQIEELESKCADNKKKLEEHKLRFQKEHAEILREQEALDKDIKRFEKEKAALSEAVDDALLKRYDLLRDNRGGFAVSAVVKGVCQMCNIGIPPQQFNELIKGDRLMTCPNCSRIIYWGENEHFLSMTQQVGS
ncbi:MAG: C4-type zinc ribbon domain-containing protein [Desulfatiglans sp.]|jgi:predicted  nucleic acid-binding Zn-ribbon protein|nr:C4-type zinc ribbon domain-containing protein [Desulfatiglans sp.]